MNVYDGTHVFFMGKIKKKENKRALGSCITHLSPGIYAVLACG